MAWFHYAGCLDPAVGGAGSRVRAGWPGRLIWLADLAGWSGWLATQPNG
jgi:hypothetical protein